MQQQCHICLSVFCVEKVHEHMHSLHHHKKIEELWGGPHVHKCWACKVCTRGLSEYKNHIATQQHIQQLHSMLYQVDRFKPDYRDVELDAKCAERDQQRIRKKKEKQKLKKKRNAELKKQRLGNTLCLMEKKMCSQAQSGVILDPGTNRNSGATHHPKEHAKTHSVGPPYRRNYMFFKSDPNPKLGSWQFERNKLEKQLSDADVSGSHLVKRQDVSKGPSAMPGSTAPPKEPELYSASPIKDNAPIKMIYNHVTHLSVELRNSNLLHPPPPETLADSGHVCSSRKVTMDTQAQLQVSASSKSARKFSVASPPEPESARKGDPHQSSGLTQPKQASTEQNVPQKKQDVPQTKHVLSALLSRSVSKAEPNKPNLKVARSIHTAQRASRVSESRVLKPALQKLLSSKSSEWKVNWEDIYQETTHRRQQREKGTPRFGIDFVSQLPPESQDPMINNVQDTVVLDEGFQWESIESDLPSTFETQHGGTVSTDPQTVHMEDLKTYIRHCRESTSDLQRAAQVNSGAMTEAHGSEQQNSSAPADSHHHHHMNKAEFKPMIRIKEEPEEHVVVVEKVSGQKTGTSQLNELLDVSVIEEKLITSLQDLDGQLIQAQAALHSAFIDVQILQMKKQQINTELETIRNERIQILQQLRNYRLDADAASLMQPGVSYTT